MDLPQDIIVTNLITGETFEDQIISCMDYEGLCQSKSGIPFYQSGIEWTPIDPVTKRNKRTPRFKFELKSDKIRKLKVLVTLEMSNQVSHIDKILIDLLARLIESYGDSNIPDKISSIEVEDYRRMHYKTQMKEKVK